MSRPKKCLKLIERPPRTRHGAEYAPAAPGRPSWGLPARCPSDHRADRRIARYNSTAPILASPFICHCRRGRVRKRYSDGKREQRTLANFFCACFVNRLVSSWGLRQRRSEQRVFRAAANLAVAIGVGCGQRENVSKQASIRGTTC